MTRIHKVVSENSVGLVLLRIALEAIQGPISPVDSRLLQIADEVVPGNISLIVAELTEQVGMAQAAYKGLRIEEFLFEAVVGDKGPRRNWPREGVEVAAVDQLVLDAVLERRLIDACEVQLVVQSSHNNQPVRGDFQHLFSTDLSCPQPISLGIVAAPRRLHPMRLPELVPQVHADHPWVILVPSCEFLAALKELILGVLIAPPQPVAVVVGTAPLRRACVIIQNYHKPNLGQSFHSQVENLHGILTNQLRVRLQVFGRDNFIIVIELERVSETDAIHFEFVANIKGNVAHRTALETINAFPTQMAA